MSTRAKTSSVRSRGYEMHEHQFISGPRARAGYVNGVWTEPKFSHSHAGGSAPHAHPNTGPASFTIDKDEWARATGLRGGSRKRYTARPSGDELPWEDLADWEKSFDVVVVGQPPAERADALGGAAVMRLVLGFRMDVRIDGGAAR